MIRACVLLVVLGLTCLGQVSLLDRFSSNAYAYKGSPGASATIATKTVYVSSIIVLNNTNAAITFRMRDRSTDCASAACAVVPDDISIAAGTVYIIPLPYVEATSGITWTCSVSSGVILRIIGSY